jgi:hypothetical protein
MKTARTVHIHETGLAIALALSAALLLPSNVKAAAGGVQNCTVSTTCVIGEFLFDDDSAPIAGATCTLTSSYPDHTSYLSSQALSGGGADGWYYYSFTAPSTTGYYSTILSCTVSGDTLSIDKSFQVVAATDTSSIASAVWNYSSRTITSLGSTVADIWKTKVITTQGATVVPIDTLVDTSTKAGEIRLLMEKLVNKPIIQNALEQTVPDLSEKLNGTRAVANQIYVNNQYLTSQSAVMVSNWNTASGKDLLSSVIDLANVLGEDGDATSGNTLFAEANWIRDSWNWDETENIYNQMAASRKIIGDLKSGLANYQKDPVLYSKAKELVQSFLALEKTIGTVTDTASGSTLFAKIKATSDLALRLDEKGSAVESLLTEYAKSTDRAGMADRIIEAKNQVLALNKVPGISGAVVNPVAGDPVSLANTLLGLKGVIDSNKIYLSVGTDKAMLNTWLEIGSIIFKTLVTNPSRLVSQEAEIKYYLPQELKKEDVIKSDTGLTVSYDVEKDQLYVEGKINLTPGQTKTFSVETKDIWTITTETISSLRKETEDLFTPLEKTAFYAQAVSLKSDINANLDQITTLLEGATTPEEKIKAYRESMILKAAVEEKIAALRSLVGQASASGNLKGFVGGSQAFAVWGIILIVIAGFVFLTIYMKKIMKKAEVKEEEPSTEQGQTLLPQASPKVNQSVGIGFGGVVGLVLVSTVLSAGVTGFVVKSLMAKNYEQKISVLGAETTAPAPDQKLGIGGQYTVRVLTTPTGSASVLDRPDGTEVAKVNLNDKLVYLGEQDGWYHIQLESGKTGWVPKDYSIKE